MTRTPAHNWRKVLTEAAARGLTVEQAANELAVNTSTVYHHAKRLDITLASKRWKVNKQMQSRPKDCCAIT